MAERLLSDDDIFGSASSGLLSDDDIFGTRTPPPGQGVDDWAGGVQPNLQQQQGLTFGQSFGRGVDLTQSMFGGALEAAGELVGSDRLAQYGKGVREANIKEAEQYGERTRVTSIKSLGDFGQWVKETVGEQIPLMAPSMAGGAAGALAGTAVGGPIGATVGGLIGAFVPSLFLGVGEVQSSIKEKDPEANAAGAAFIGGSAIAALDSALPGKIGSTLVRAFGRETAEEIAERTLTKQVNDAWITRAAKGGASGMVTEGFTEALQEAIGEVAASKGVGQNIDWSGLGEQMLEAAAAGALMGGAAGSVTSAIPPPERTATAREVLDQIPKRINTLEQMPARSADEQAELDFLRQNRNNPQAVANWYGFRIRPETEQGAPQQPSDIPEGAVPASDLFGEEVVTPARAQAQAATAPPTPEDIESPIPTDLIQQGKTAILEAEIEQAQPTTTEAQPSDIPVRQVRPVGAEGAPAVGADTTGAGAATAGSLAQPGRGAAPGPAPLRTDDLPGADQPGAAGPALTQPSPSVTQQAEQVTRAPIRSVPVQDAEDTAITASGREVPVRYAVVEAADLVTSQTDDLRTNAAYPAELQPRDRTRAVSQQQIQDIASRLNPRLLDRSARASDGAPIISADGVVESGNGRVLAIRRAYSQGQAEQYRDYLLQQGYNTAGMKQPVLVRIREGEMTPEDRQAFTREANERDTLGMSATERAMADAAALPDSLLDLYQGGDVDLAGNRDFVRGFIERVVGRNDQAGMIAGDGSMSQEAIRRIEGALLAKAYGDTDLVASLIESADTNIRAIGGALMDVSVSWAQMRAQAQQGTIDPSMDQTDRLLDAVRLVQRARRERRSLTEFVGQTDMLTGSSVHPVAEAFLRLMFRNTQSWTQPAGREKLANALRFYLDQADKAQPGVDLLGDTAPAPETILETARDRQYAEDRQAAQQEDLLAQPAGRTGDRGAQVGREREGDQPGPAPARESEAARAGEQGAGTQPQVAAPARAPAGPVRIENFTDKAIIVRGLTEDDAARWEGVKASPLWNAKQKGWVFSKKREAEVRAALADLLRPAQAQGLASGSQLDPATQQALAQGLPTDTKRGGDAAESSTLAVEAEGQVNVPSDRPSDTSQRDAATTEGGLDVGPGDAEFPANVLKAHPGIVQGFGSLDVPGQRAVVGLVRRAAHDFEVLRSIISRVPVDVMNNLIGGEFSAQDLLNDVSVLTNALDAVDPSSDVLAAFVDAAVLGSAAIGTEVSGSGVTSGVVGGPASGTSQRNQAVSSNRIFTDEAAERARSILRSKLSQLNTGLDPEVIQAGITLAGWHVERGARSFAAYSRAMIADLGEAVRPYLRSWYEGVRYYPGFNAEGMSAAAEIDAALEPESSPADTGSQAVAQHFAQAFAEGRAFGSITEARRTAGEVLGRTVEPGTRDAKLVDEAVELGAVIRARQIVEEGGAPQETYRRLVELYGQMPNLSTRTSTSVAQQAYSTPVPLAYLAARLGGIDAQTRVYEPTAGNGALLITADPANVLANELNPDRATNLRATLPGASVTDHDAAEWSPRGRYDVVIGNPPFGAVKDADGQTRRFQVDERYETGEIDHAISMKALESMRDDGAAVLIVGSVAKTARSEDARSDAYNAKAKREFYLTLYGAYNVVDHFTVAGELYAKQGAGWPVDVIVIRGRGKSTRPLPAVEPPRLYESWDALAEVIDAQYQETAGRARTADRGRDRGEPEPASLDGRDRPGSRKDRPGREQRQPTPREPADLREGSVDGQPRDARPAQPQSRDTARPAEDQRPASSPRRDPVAVEGENARQVAYQPSSRANSMGTLVPVNMQTAVQDALERLRDRVGDIDSFVADRLGYQPGEIGNYFGAEQIDAIALALDNMERGAGFIIGDQTGIGKGRVVAAIIRYALRSNRTPIFVTEKPNLYGDMYRDLTDIGVDGMLGRKPSILMTNAAQTVPLDEAGTVLKTGAAASHNRLLTDMANAGQLDGYDMVFTTYSQMQTLKGEVTPRMQFLEAMARGGIVIFDESHNAGGSAQSSNRGGKQQQQDMNRATFARNLARAAHGVFYSSATYAKRPDVMDLYATTDMRLAVSDISHLAEAIQKGGVPMQQVVASMLSGSGQYIRRERSFDGVTYNAPVVAVPRTTYGGYSQALNAIQQFSEKVVTNAVKRLDKELKAEGKSLSYDGSTGGAGAASTNFTSIMHNLIDQMLLAIKSDVAAERAIEAIRSGEKPVITVANTMGSFIQDYVDDLGIRPGDRVDLTFNALLERYLDRTRWISVRKPFMKKGDQAEKKYLTDAELGSAGAAMFEQVRQMIRDLDLSAMPVSPIDHIRMRLQQAGYKVGEITGRTATLDYRQDGSYYRVRPAKDASIAGRRKAIADFNSGALDAMIINQAGSTGLSLHASERFKDQRKRRMIIAQAEKNIDTHMQMLGRVHRTGQVVTPEYDQLVADVPAEKRPAAVLAKKMASLNANTTASRGGALMAEDVPDFMNQYGDEVAARVMGDMPEIHAALGSPLKDGEDGFEVADAMRKVTGRIPLLPVDQQEMVYDLLESEYRALIEQKEAAGESALEAKTLELDAQVEDRRQVVAPTGDNSPFADGVYVEIANVKRQGKPHPTAKVLEMVAESLGLSNLSEENMSIAHAAGQNASQRMIQETEAELQAYRREVLDDMVSDEARRAANAKLEGQTTRFRALLQTAPVGRSVKLMTDAGNFYGVVTRIQRTGKAKNPVALGSWKVTVALTDASRQITIPMSQLHTEATAPSTTTSSEIIVAWAEEIMPGMPVIRAFDELQSESRETRTIITGNLLAGFDHVNGKGAIINFTDSDGNVRQGILMPRDFNYDEQQKERPVDFRSSDQVLAFIELGHTVKSADGAVAVSQAGDQVRIEVAGSKARGGRYFLDPGILRAVGSDFVRVGDKMRADVPRAQAPQALEEMKRAGAGFRATDNLAEARRIAGSVSGEPQPSAPAARIEESQPSIVYSTYEPEVSNISSRERGVSEPSETAQIDLFAPSGVPDNTARAQSRDNFNIQYRQVEVGSFKVGLDTVLTPEDAAHVMAPLRKHAQESFLVLVTDKNGKILNLIRHTKGLKAESSVSPLEVAGAVASTEGSAVVWLGHNHPSGSTEPSNSDARITERLIQAFDGLGVQVKGHIILPGGQAATLFTDRYDATRIPIRPALRARKQPLTERVLRRKNLNQAPSILNDTDAKNFVSTLDEDSIVLLSNSHQVVGTIVMSPAEMKSLREGGRVRRILSALDTTNSAAAVIYTNDQEAAANLARFFKSVDSNYRVLDWISKRKGELVSDSASGGRTVMASGPFYSVRDGSAPTQEGGSPASIESLTADLSARLKQLGIADKVALNLRDSIQAVVNGRASEADGRYLNRVIEVSLAARDGARTLNHEVIHALRDMGLIRDAEWRTLERAVRADKDRMANIRSRYGSLNLSEARLGEEAIADAFADWKVGQLEAKGFLRTAFERIRNFLEALGNALRGNGFNSADSIFRAIDRGDVGRRPGIDTAAGVTAFSADFGQPSNYTFNESDYRPSVVSWAKDRWGAKPVETVTVSPRELLFRESDQSRDRVADVRERFGGDDMPPIVVARTGGGLLILDGHHRASVAREDGLPLRAVVVSEEAYAAAKAEGYDEVDISHAALEEAGEGEAASLIRQQFNGSGLAESEQAIREMLEASPVAEQIAPNGKPIWQNFVRWFGDSKVVDENGQPLAVYHGTPTGGFTVFRKDYQGRTGGRARGGFSFTTRRDRAASYAEGFSDETVNLDEAVKIANAAMRTLNNNQEALAIFESMGYDIDAGAPEFYWGSIDDNAEFADYLESTAYELRRIAPDAAQQLREAARLLEGFDRVPEVKEVYLRVPPDAPEFSATPETLGDVVASLDVREVPGKAAVVNMPDGEKVFYVAEPEQIKSATDNTGSFDPENPDIMFALADPGVTDPTAPDGAHARQRAADQWYGSQPLDQAMRLPFHLFGGINERGEWKWGQNLSRKTANLIQNATFSAEGRFAWMNGLLEKARAGLLDRYGLDPAYVERERQRGLDERRIMAQVPEIMQALKDAKIGTAEAKVLQAILTGEEVADADMARLAEPIRNAIDDMGAEAVQLGLLSAESFERNRGAYLHRVYLKHENDQGALTRWVSRVASQKRRKIIGNQFKGRGLWIEVPRSRLTRDLPGFTEAERGQPVQGEKFRVLDLVEGEGQETLRGIDPNSRRRVLNRVFLPADAPVPANLMGYADRGIWEVRGAKGGNLVLWRDFTKTERESMGEIVDARYTIAKTYMQMAHDLATGRFFKDIALNEDWSTGIEPRGIWKNAEEYNRFWADPEIEWVRVPDTKIPKSNTKRYGALAGRFVRAEIWRDLAELERMQKPGMWDAVLTQWKLNKALALDTPIPTPTGWTTMGAIKVGDTVFDEKGRPCTVLEVKDIQHGRPCFEVAFSDGTKIVADDEHWWFTRHRNRGDGVRTTKEIRETLTINHRGEAAHSIPVAGALDLPEADLPIPPYALGVWLGDGDKAGPRMSIGGDDIEEMFRHLSEVGVYCSEPTKDKRNNVYSFTLLREPGKCIRGHDDRYRNPTNCGLCERMLKSARAGETEPPPIVNAPFGRRMDELRVRGNKHIPAIYLRASASQRRELLMGLMDSDGCVTRKGDCVFVTSTPKLRDGFLELARSLGYKPAVKEVMARLNGEDTALSWRIYFKAYADEPVAKLARKAGRLKPRPASNQRSSTRQIVSITPVPSVPVRCIAVSSPSHLYLAGEGMVPTHNTARSPVVHMNNILSNAVLMDLADVRLVDLARGIRSMIRQDQDYQDAVDHGAFGSDMVAVEIRKNTLQPLLEEIERDMQGGMDTFEAKVGVLGKLADAIWSRAKNLDRKMTSLYQLEDEVFRMATYMRKRDLGLEPNEAALQARDQFLNYDIRAPWVNAARRSVLPFISYTYRAVPVVAQSVMLRPWKLAKYATVGYVANALAYMVAGGDEDEERRSLDETESGLTWIGAPRMIRMPYSDPYGNPVFLDVRRWIPAGDVFDMNQGHSSFAIPAPLQFGGPIMLAGEVAFNKMAFTGQPITNDRTDDWWDKTAKHADWAWKSWMPSAAWIPGSWYWERIGRAMTGARDPQGRPYSPASAIPSAFGVKLKPQDVQESFYWKGVEFDRIESELKAELRRLGRDLDRGMISRTTFERREARILEKMENLGLERERTFSPR